MSVINLSPQKPVIRPQSSKFTYHDLNQLNDRSRSYLSRLAVIGHLDLNAFFAQVEQVRLNLTINDPVVCVQWQAVIAVSYAARKFGIKRMDTIKTVKEKCPNVVLAHAAVYEKGSSKWKYVDKLPFQGHCKVSLDPYRRESRKIFKILSENCDLVQKASVDEGYLDFGRLVYDKIRQLVPFSDNPDDILPPIPEDLEIEYFGKLYNVNGVEINDWDDVAILMASNYLFNFRKQIFEKLGYTTSGGVSRSKNMAKLAGGFLKPDNQTILLNSQIPNFLKNFELTEINGLGGKLGEQILSQFSVPPEFNSIEYLTTLPEEDVKSSEFDHLYEIIRGDFRQELKDRTDIKSMMSRKQMMGNAPLLTLFDCLDWLKTFSGDLCNRLEDLDEEFGQLTRPKTISVSALISGTSHSRQLAIPVQSDLGKLRLILEKTSVKLLLDLVKSLFDIDKLNDGKYKENAEINRFNKVKIPPIMNFAIIISSLQRLDSSIDNFAKKEQVNLFEKFENEQKLQQQTPEAQKPPEPKKKLDKEFISNLFAKYEQSKSESPSPERIAKKRMDTKKRVEKPKKHMDTKRPKYNILESLNRRCKECGEIFNNVQEHNDFHTALQLSRESADPRK
ncbi:DNA polymerase eta [[Candida] jaroonii]|uniref:DNA polymerase eta n=1 Tax=[Candida] jaroonii TaxID=467808 RepID=A0ACA9Y9A3_9ASCO|nr:DNA polymerase eta [[Candida] jaroonii]